MKEAVKMAVEKDNSPQGFVDEDIKSLLGKINSHADYETTSSCSGRIVLIDASEDNEVKKGSAKWIFKTHKAADPEGVWNLVRQREMVWFLQEPLIMHIRCSGKDSAQKLLEIANKTGLKHSGIVSANTWTVELRGSERIETPLWSAFVSKDFVFNLVKEANKRLLKTKQRLASLENCF